MNSSKIDSNHFLDSNSLEWWSKNGSKINSSEIDSNHFLDSSNLSLVTEEE